MAKTTKQIVGAWGEDQASLFLSKKGYKIVDRNYEVNKMGKKVGEVDIIAKHKKYHHGETLCFVEVKTRSYPKPEVIEEGEAERATGRQKMLRLQRAAKHYCFEHNIDIERSPIQFEQISIYVFKPNKKVTLRHYVIPVE